MALESEERMEDVERAAPVARSTNWVRAVISGLLAGLLFLVLEMAMVPLFLGGSPWAPVRLIGAILLGQDVLPPPASFDATVAVVALIIHLVMSTIYGLIVGALVHDRETAVALLIGFIFGLVLYFVNFYGFTVIFPWFAQARNWVTIFNHLAFGVATAALYKSLTAGAAEIT